MSESIERYTQQMAEQFGEWMDANQPADEPVGTLLVGAEGVAETKDEPWIREALDIEAMLFWKKWEEHAMANGRTFDRGEYTIDGNGRPYWLMTVLGSAPPLAKEKARTYARTLRLTE